MKKNQSGFTLIEIAIVMVIIGLLLGGVLKGQAMINSAKVRSLNNKVDGATAAWFAFQDRFRAYPGDFNLASTQILSTLANGGNNGQVAPGAEAGDVWTHLSGAGFISGSYNSGNSNDDLTCSTATCPDNGFGLGISIMYGNAGLGNVGTVNEMRSGQQIPVAIVAELDRKIDDGLANNGSVRSATASAACVTAPNYNVTGASTNCALIFRNL